MTKHDSETSQACQPGRRKLTNAEAEAILTLVRGGWLKLVPTMGDDR